MHLCLQYVFILIPNLLSHQFIGLGAKLTSLSNDFVLNSVKGLSPFDQTNKSMENGIDSPNCISQDMYSSNAAMTNGLKEAAALQASLIGQPQVRYLSAESGNNGEGLAHKKMKTVWRRKGRWLCFLCAAVVGFVRSWKVNRMVWGLSYSFF